jgi:hypothetical protein
VVVEAMGIWVNGESIEYYVYARGGISRQRMPFEGLTGVNSRTYSF